MERGTVGRKGLAEKSLSEHTPFIIEEIYSTSEARNCRTLIVSPPVNYLGAPHKRVLSSICLKK